MALEGRKGMISLLPLLIQFHGVTSYMCNSNISKLNHSYAVKVSPDKLSYCPCRARWFGVSIPDSRSSMLKVDPRGKSASWGRAFESFFAEDWPNLRRNNRSDGECGCRDGSPSVLLTRKTHSLVSLSPFTSYNTWTGLAFIQRMKTNGAVSYDAG